MSTTPINSLMFPNLLVLKSETWLNEKARPEFVVMGNIVQLALQCVG